MILRDPVERLYSQHAEAVARGDVRQGSSVGERAPGARRALSSAAGSGVERVLCTAPPTIPQDFAAEQVRSYLYEDLCAWLVSAG
jgi:hypothetical protein